MLKLPEAAPEKTSRLQIFAYLAGPFKKGG